MLGHKGISLDSTCTRALYTGTGATNSVGRKLDSWSQGRGLESHQLLCP